MRRRATAAGVVVAILGAVPASGAFRFRFAATEKVFGGAESLTVARLDADPNFDLIFAGGSSGGIRILWGRGDGEFDEELDDPRPGNAPVGVAVADFNGDERNDMATIDTNRPEVSVLLATGAREFSLAPVITNPRRCSQSGGPCEDDRDCPQNGPPGSDRCVNLGVSLPTGIAAADLDSDGVADVAVAAGEEARGAVAILLGLGDGRFEPLAGGPLHVGAGAKGLTIADVDRDGRPDVLTANAFAGSVSILLNRLGAGGEGGFEPANVPVDESPEALVAGDWNADGRVDLVVVDRTGPKGAVFLAGDGRGGFVRGEEFEAGRFPSAAAAADFDGDGNLDVAVASNLSYDVLVAYGDGAGRFPRRRSFLAGPNPVGLIAAALRTDAAEPDLVALNKTGEGDAYTVLVNRGHGDFEAGETFPVTANPTAAAVADIDCDGRPDAVVVSSQENRAMLLLAGEANQTRMRDIDVGLGSKAVLLADVTRDGFPDLVLAQQGDGLSDRVIVAPGDGRGGFYAPRAPIFVGPSTGPLVAADVDGDGRLDLVVTEGTSGTSVGRIRVLWGSEGGAFDPGQAVDVGSPSSDHNISIIYSPQAIAVGELSGDGLVDVAVASTRITTTRRDGSSSRTDGILTLLRGDVGRAFDAPQPIPSGARPHAIAISDVDADGLRDRVSVNEGQGLLVTRNAEGGNFESTALPSGALPVGLALRDLDGNLVPDAAVVDQNSDRVLVRPGRRSAPFFGNPDSFCPNANCVAVGRTPTAVLSADFDGNGQYDLFTLNFGGWNGSIVYNDLSSTTCRGDANGDHRRTAADVIGILRGLRQQARTEIEEATALGLVPSAGADADGDGLLTPTDVLAGSRRALRGIACGA